jgi:ribonuclease HI
MHNWQAAGWKVSKQNLDLWRIIYALKQKFKRVTVHWVKGHSGIELNERVDQLNQQALIEKGLR